MQIQAKCKQSKINLRKLYFYCTYITLLIDSPNRKSFLHVQISLTILFRNKDYKRVKGSKLGNVTRLSEDIVNTAGRLE